VQTSLGPLIILPRATPISVSAFHFGDLKDKGIQMSRELVEGIAFLHRQKIAHLDVKPGNLVYSWERQQLYIIDLGLAMRCKDVDEMVEISCGTPGWNAPEIALDDDEPVRPFSPIRADLWSCGKVLQFLFKMTGRIGRDIMLLMDLLMDRDPRRRPLLHEVVDEEPDFWTSGRLIQAIQCQVHGNIGDNELKRAYDGATNSDEQGLAHKIAKVNDATNQSLSLSSCSSSPPRTPPQSPFGPLSHPNQKKHGLPTYKYVV
jgi:serine/threonine protein kinase